MQPFHPQRKPDTCDALEDAERNGQLALTAVGRGKYPGRRLPPQAPEIRSVGLWDATSEQDWGLGWHCNEGIEISFLEFGDLRLQVDGNDRQLHSGAAVVTRPWQPHRVGIPTVSPSRFYWFILDVGVRQLNGAWRWPKWILLPKKDRVKLTRFLRLTEEPVWQATQGLAHAFRELGRVAGLPVGNQISARLQVAINGVLLALLEVMESSTPPRDPKPSSSEQTVRFFLNNLHDRVDELWTLEQMATECRLSRSQFASYCRAIRNQTPLEFLNECRIKKAQELLRNNPTKSITDVGFDCGFQSSQYFATVMRKVTGQTPREFRNFAHDKKPTAKSGLR